MHERDLPRDIARRFVPKEHRPAVRRKLYDLQDLVDFGVTNLFRYGRTDMFQRVNFELNGACNYNKCWYCLNSVVDGRDGKMSDEIFNTMVLQLSEIGRAGFGGIINPSFFGEPTAYGQDLAEKMAEIKEYLPKSTIWFHTNGILLTPDLYRDLFRAGVNHFIVTNHPGAPTENIKRLRDELSDEEKRRMTDRTLDHLKLWNRPPYIVIPPQRVLHLERCQMPSTQLTIVQNGDVLLCFQDFDTQHIYGNITQESIPDIWEKENYKQERENIRKGIYTLALCKQCMDKEL